MMDQKKPYYSIGQVAEYFELPQSVLRYWETVFDALNPAKSPGGSRRYSDQDLQVIHDIKHLLYERGFTIRGANKILNQKYKIDPLARATQAKPDHSAAATKSKSPSNAEQSPQKVDGQIIKKIIRELYEIVRVLEN